MSGAPVLAHFLVRLRSAIEEYEKADAIFKARSAFWQAQVHPPRRSPILHRLTRPGLTKSDARIAARKDSMRMDAGGDRIHYRDEAMMYALAYLSEVMAEEQLSTVGEDENGPHG